MAITIPNVFVAGTRIESAPVNANFAAMTNALDKTGDTITGNMVVGTGITIDGLDISTVPQTGGTFNPNSIVFTNVILGAATTAGIRLDLESGTLAVREGDDSAYGPMLASVYNVPTGGSVNFNAGSAALTWDTTESTANLALSANVDYKLGAQELVRCVNRTGTAIAKGKAVYIVGAHGNRPQIALADASDESTASTTLGITAESIADTAEGFVCISGMLRGLNTNSLTEGQIVWLSETAGELTSTRPTQPAHGVFMGLCVRQQPGTSGILYISVVNGLELEELHDVLITTPSANQILKRNSGNTLWVNSSGTALTKTDDTNVTLTLGGSASTALVNAASLTLGWTGTLAAGRLNSNVVQAITNDTNVTGSISAQTLTLGWTGQLALSRGGTGASTAQAALNTLAGAVTSGQYLRGNGTNVVMSAIQVSDVPTLNQNTTGTAAGLSSTLAVSSGGTGQTTYTDGQLLIGNSVGNTLTKATLTAGSNIAITNGNGSITIAATAGGGTVTSVGGTGTVNGITLTGSVTTSGNLTLGGTLSGVNLTSQVTGTLPLANGGTGQTTAQAAINSLAGATTSGQYLRGNGTNVVMSAIQAGDVPTLNQNTTGTAANVTGVVAAANGGTGQTSVQAAMNSLAGATTSGQYLRGNGTNVVMSAIQAGDVPTLNQNTTGTAAGLSATLAVSSGGTGQTSYTDGQLLIGNSATSSLSKTTLSAGSGVTIVNGNGTITIAATGSGGTITVVGATSPVLSSGGTTPVISLDAAYGDTLNPYGSKTANFVLAAPNGSAGTPSFRALVAADIPTLNQNTTGTAAGLSSTLAVGSGGTGQTTYTDGELLIGNSTGNTLTKATLTAGTGVTITNGAGAITINATGTGGTVTSVSGTGTASGLSLSGTVTTTGSLTLSGTVDSMSALAGSVSAPSIAASGDTNTGIFFPAADTIAATTGGTERLRIDSAGNVGIGTTPSAFLGSRVIQLDRTSVLGSTNNGFVSTNVYTDGSWRYIAAAAATQYWQGDGTHVWRSGGTGSTGAVVSWVEQARLTLAGAFILGSGEASATPTGNTFRATSGTGTDITGGTLTITAGNGTGTGGSGNIIFQTAPAGSTGTIANTMTERLRITAGGFVGIGTTSPSGSLEIASNTDGNMYIGRYTTDAFSPSLVVRKARGTVASPTAIATNDFLGSYLFQGFGGTNWRTLAQVYAYVSNYTSDTNITSYLGFSTTNAGSSSTERFRIAGNGDISIGATAKWFLDGVGGGDTYLTESSANNISVFTGGTERVTIDSTGDLGIGVTAPGAVLDIARDAAVGGRITRYSTDASSPTWALRKARGTQASPTAVAVSDDIATLAFSAYGGTTFSDVASIKATMNRVASNTDMGVDITIGSANAGTSALPKLKIAGNQVAFPTTGSMYFDMDPNTGAITGNTGIVWNGGSNQIALHTGGAQRFLVANGGVGIVATAKIWLDGTALTGDTYLTESAANVISFFAGGTERFRINGVSSGNIAIPAIGRLYLDGVTAAGDTYVAESSANVMSFTAGGTEGFRVEASQATLPTGGSLGWIRGGTSTGPYFQEALGALRLYTDGAEHFVAFNGASKRFSLNSAQFEVGPGATGSSDIRFKVLGSSGAAGTVVIGHNDASATPGAQKMTLRGANGSGTNIAGASLFLAAGNGTGTGGSGAIVFETASTGSSGTTANTLTERVRIDRDGNVGINVSTFGTSAAGVLGLKNGTEPTTGPADTVQVYSVDLSAGNTIPAIYTEGTGATTAGITNTTVTNKIAIKINGTVYYLLATTNAT